MTTKFRRAAAPLLTSSSSSSTATASTVYSTTTATRALFTDSTSSHRKQIGRHRSHQSRTSSLALLFTITAAAVASSSCRCCPLFIQAFSIGVGSRIAGSIRRTIISSASFHQYHHRHLHQLKFQFQHRNPSLVFLGGNNNPRVLHPFGDATSITPSTSNSPRSLSSLIASTRGGAISSLSSTTLLGASKSTIATTAAAEMMDAVKRAAASKTANEKLTLMRNKMKECNVDAYLIPSDDPHLSEYVPAAYMRRGYMTDFHGSAGTALVTTTTSSSSSSSSNNNNNNNNNNKEDESNKNGGEESDEIMTEDNDGGGGEGSAYLWTDSRYHNEASLRLDSRYWKLMKQGQPKVPSITKFISDMAVKHYNMHGKPLVVGMDPYVHSAAFAKELKMALDEAAKEVMVAVDVGKEEEMNVSNGSGMENKNGIGNALPSSSSPPVVVGILDTLDGRPNIVDSIWEGRPAIPKNPFRVQPMEYAGMSVVDKVAKIRSDMKDKKATLVVFSALDDIAYLFNMRCMNDVETCPVGIAYATISHEQVTLYCDTEKVQSAEVMEHLNSANVTIQPYDNIVDDIRTHLSSDLLRNKVWLDSSRSNYALSRAILPTSSHVDAQNPITPMKACKNDAEMRGMRRAHIEDGAAMAEFMSWLEHTIVVEGRTVSEVEIDTVLTACRAKRPGFMEVSFPTIAGVGSNGAIVHYRAAEDSDLLKHLDRTKPVLIDSGGQYTYGTTDVTRTWHFGENPSDEFRDMYTRVLKGNIGVDTMIFPENTPGFVLDVFARKALWEVGKDYGHGTGHGVGAALNVHEGPHSISPRWANKEVLKKGMVTSNEPGFYDDGNFGIRIENLLEIVDVAASTEEINGEGLPPSKKQKKEAKTFLKFAHLTQIPIQKNLINLDIMTAAELDWLDAYHDEVLQKVAPLLEEGSPAMKWLVKSCEKIDRST